MSSIIVVLSLVFKELLIEGGYGKIIKEGGLVEPKTPTNSLVGFRKVGGISMNKYVLMVASIVMIVLAIMQIVYAYLPTTGPSGNGPNMVIVWSLATPILIGGICFLSLSIYQIVKEKNTK